MRESEKRQRKERDQRRVAIAVVAAVGRRGSVPRGPRRRLLTCLRIVLLDDRDSGTFSHRHSPSTPLPGCDAPVGACSQLCATSACSWAAFHGLEEGSRCESCASGGTLARTTQKPAGFQPRPVCQGCWYLCLPPPPTTAVSPAATVTGGW